MPSDCRAEHVSVTDESSDGPPARLPVLQDEPFPLPDTEQYVVVLFDLSDCVEQVSPVPSKVLHVLPLVV